MKSFFKGIGFMIYFGAGLIMLIGYFVFLNKWFGFLGIVLGIIITPGFVIFPLIYWIKMEVFPFGYFIIWGIGVIGGSFFVWLGTKGDYQRRIDLGNPR